MSGTLVWMTAEGKRRSAPVEIEHAGQRGMRLRAPEPLTLGQTVLVGGGPVECKASICLCTPQEPGFLLGVEFVREERRRADRVPAAGRGRLQWVERSGPREAAVRVSNVTEDGIQIELEQSLEFHQIVRLAGEAWECLGRVRYCRNEGARFTAGIKLTMPAYPKNSLDYTD